MQNSYQHWNKQIIPPVPLQEEFFLSIHLYAICGIIKRAYVLQYNTVYAVYYNEKMLSRDALQQPLFLFRSFWIEC